MKNSIKTLVNISKTLRLLYVEDNAITRLETLTMLKNFFDDIVVAEDGEEGLAKFKTSEFDLIISDINMPKMNGLEMLEIIRKEDKEIVFIIVSAHNDSKHFSTSIKLGTDGYLLKPLESESFLTTLQKVTSKIALKKENEAYKKQLENQNSDLTSQLQERTKDLEKKLMIDDLTKLKSRYAFLQILNQTEERDAIPIIFLLNIDAFGLYNELYGIDTGNEILIKFAMVLDKFASKYGYECYRISGDEFALFESVDRVDEYKNSHTINTIIEMCERDKYWIEHIEDNVEISVTMGVCTDKDHPLEKADMALKNAKTSGERYALYHKSIDTKAELENVLYWKKEIMAALQERRVVPYFQPIVDCHGKILKYEALMRIKQLDENGQYKIISPFHFLDIAHRTKLYNSLSYNLVLQAIEMMENQSISLSLNINLSDLQNKKMVTMLKEKIASFHQHSDKHIILEILEDDHIKDYEIFKAKLLQFKNLGAKIAIDDFGSGFSNFSHIIGISPNYVKIDGSLIKHIHEDEKSFQMVKAVVQFAKSLGIQTIAEFVSSKEIFEVAQSLGVDQFQGYYFSEPVDIEVVRKQLQDQSATSSREGLFCSI
jgi:diguanylate cyclase (GGDEF)-like protein